MQVGGSGGEGACAPAGIPASPANKHRLPFGLPFTPLPHDQMAMGMGFLYCASGPMVRSSYRAGEFFLKGMLQRQKAEEAAAAGQQQAAA